MAGGNFVIFCLHFWAWRCIIWVYSFSDKEGAYVLVRVYDNQLDTYFVSEVYAVINPGWYEKRLVIVPSESGDYFKFYDYIDKSDPQAPKVIINTIYFKDFYSAFESLHRRMSNVDEIIDEYTAMLNADIRFFDYRGYSWIFENKTLLTKLLCGEIVPISEYNNRIIDPNAYKVAGWNYVVSQNDIDFLLEKTSAFHDTVLKEINYISGSYVDDKNSIYCTDNERRVTMRFDSQWCRHVEMVFEGVTALNLRPSTENTTSNIYGASVFICNASVFFCDEQMDDVDRTYNGTWIEAYSLRWKFEDKS